MNGNTSRSGEEGEDYGSVTIPRRRVVCSKQNGKRVVVRLHVSDPPTNSFQSDLQPQPSLLEKYAIPVFVCQIIAFFGWTGAVLYCTYRIYAESDELMPFFVAPENNKGPLTSWLNRSWDPLDSEWNLLGFIMWAKLIVYFAFYKIVEHIAINNGFSKLSSWVSPFVSFLMIYELINLNAAIIFYAAPVMYWAMLRARSKTAIWILCLFCILIINSPISRLLLNPSAFSNLHMFGIFFGWNISRCVSFCFDVWDRPESEKFSLEYLGNFIKYIGYVPLVPSGPLVLYHHFEDKILKKNIAACTVYVDDVAILLKSLMKLFAFTCILVLHQYFLYYRPLAYTVVPVYQMSLWAICGSIYWLGQSFSLKYKILYGIPSAFCELDGLDMYPLPCCIAYVHRYSALWKDFDRGLYLFLVRYIYIPMVQWFREVDPQNKLNYELKKFIASFTTFGYIFVWHSITYEVFIWTAFNFLGVTIERIGSAIKRKVDSAVKLDPLIWDFLVEPLVCVPLAAMSILNSSVFCGSLEMATHFSNRLWTNRADNYSWYFLYFFCHCGVAVRNWPKLLPLLKMKLRLAPN